MIKLAFCKRIFYGDAMPGPEKMRDTGCPIAFALDTFGDRWSLLIVRDMLLKRYETFGEFLDGDEAIATNVLADRLKQLEAVGVIRKSNDPNDKRKHIYRFTEKGFELTPVVLEMIRWSAKYDPKTIVVKRVLDKVRNDRESFMAELRARIVIE